MRAGFLLPLVFILLAGCVDVPSEPLSRAGTRVENVTLADESFQLGRVEGWQQRVDVDVPQGAESIVVELVLGGAFLGVSWDSIGACADQTDLLVGRESRHVTTCEAPEPGRHSLHVRLEGDGHALVDVRIVASVRTA